MYNSRSNPGKPSTKQNIKSALSNTNRVPSTRPTVTPREVVVVLEDEVRHLTDKFYFIKVIFFI